MREVQVRKHVCALDVLCVDDDGDDNGDDNDDDEDEIGRAHV